MKSTSPMLSSSTVYSTFAKAGDDLDLRHFGARAVESMRIEKGYRHWKADLLTEFDPFESGLGRFVDLGKPFLGKEALERRLQAPDRKAFVTLEIDASHAPAHPGASILEAGKIVGTVTSGDWGHRTGRNLAMGFVDADRGRDRCRDRSGHTRYGMACTHYRSCRLRPKYEAASQPGAVLIVG